MPRDLINHLKSKPVTQIANSPKPSDDDDENPYQVDEELEEVVTKNKDEQSEEWVTIE